MWILKLIRSKQLAASFTAVLALSACGGSGGEDGGGFAGISLSAQAISTTSIRLSWTEPSRNISFSPYRIVRDDAGSTSVVASTSNLTYTVVGLTPGTQYCFVITDPVTGTAASNRACATTPTDNSSPTTPTGLTATATTPAEVNLAWDFASDDTGIAGYNVYRDGALIFSVTSRIAVDTNPVAGVNHCYQVSAFDGAGNESPRSGEVCIEAEPDFSPPTTPSNASAIFDGSGDPPAIEVTWLASVDDGVVSFYRIFRNDVYIDDAQDTAYADRAIGQDESYCYRISAVDSYGNESELSAPACAREGWTSITLGSTTALATAVAVDNSGTVHVAFKEHLFEPDIMEIRHPLTHATIEAGQVTMQNVVESGTETYFVTDAYRLAMLADQNNIVHIAHKRNEPPAAEEIRHLQIGGGSVTPGTIEVTSENMDSVSLAVGSSGAIHACYGLGGRLMYATNVTGAWIVTDADTLVAGAAGNNCDIDIGYSDNIHISFLEQGTGDLMYLGRYPEGWLMDRIDVRSGSGTSSNYQTSIAADRSGELHIAYFHGGANNQLEYAYTISGGWKTAIVDSDGDVGHGCELAIDSRGIAHIVYRKRSEFNRLMYTRNASGTWTSGILSMASPGDMSIAIDEMDDIHVTFVSDDKATYLTTRN